MHSWYQIRKGIADFSSNWHTCWSHGRPTVLSNHRCTVHQIRQSRSWTIRSCHVTTLEKMKSNRKKRLMILLLKSQVLGNSFIFIVLGLLANLLSVAVLWKQRKMFIYKLFLAMSFADLVVSFLARTVQGVGIHTVAPVCWVPITSIWSFHVCVCHERKISQWPTRPTELVL